MCVRAHHCVYSEILPNHYGIPIFTGTVLKGISDRLGESVKKSRQAATAADHQSFARMNVRTQRNNCGRYCRRWLTMVMSLWLPHASQLHYAVITWMINAYLAHRPASFFFCLLYAKYLREPSNHTIITKPFFCFVLFSIVFTFSVVFVVAAGSSMRTEWNIICFNISTRKLQRFFLCRLIWVMIFSCNWY